jgi:exodeoxyribonuclease-3
MKAANFNVNSLRARESLVLDWLKQKRPDILCVQETKVQDEDFPSDGFEEAGYHCVFRGQKSYNGVAIFSRKKLTDVSFGFEEEPLDEARMIKARYGEVVIVNTYVPQGYKPDSEKFEYKLDWFRRLRAYFEKNFSPDEPVLWMGDLNVAPEAIDVYEPDMLWGHVCFNAQVQEALKGVMSWGFVDVFRKHCKGAGQYTYWDYRMRGSLKLNLGWRIDHILATKALASKSIACWIDREPRAVKRPSDHTPIIAEFDL